MYVAILHADVSPLSPKNKRKKERKNITNNNSTRVNYEEASEGRAMKQ